MVELAQKELKDDPAFELYSSGARGSFDNAYRQWLCTKGPIWNAHKGEFEIVTNSLYEGIPKENIPSLANAVVSGFYPKAIGTGKWVDNRKWNRHTHKVQYALLPVPFH